METSHVHKIDPEGDIIIRLRASNSAFATWHEEPDYLPSTPPRSISDAIDEPAPETTPEPAASMSDIEDELTIEPEPEVESEPSLTETEPTSSITIRPTSDQTVLAEEKHSDDKCSVEVRVSSRHLILASPQAKRMLEGAWKERHTFKLQGFLVMEEKDWDADAFMVLMNILHCRNRSVPKKISLDLLTRIAVLVDYYECYEAVQIYSDMWIEHLRQKFPETYSRTLVLWICISWVFSKEEDFEQATRIAIKQCKDRIQTMELPIPERIVRKSSLDPIQRHV
jgi:hypothetical protein